MGRWGDGEVGDPSCVAELSVFYLITFLGVTQISDCGEIIAVGTSKEVAKNERSPLDKFYLPINIRVGY